MASLWKNWRVWLVIVLLAVSLISIGLNGLRFGIDFSGGTLFQVHLEKPITDSEQMIGITKTLSQRINFTGLRDTRVSSFGTEFVLVEIAETEPDKIAAIENLIRSQGKFENVINGEIVFTGEDIVTITKDPAKGYGFRGSADNVTWVLPFVLTDKAARSFTSASFHQCVLESYAAESGAQYDCEKTFFFLDRPANSILLLPENLWQAEQILPVDPSRPDSSSTITAEELLENAQLEVITYGNDWNALDWNALMVAQSAGIRSIVLPDDAPTDLKTALENQGFKIKSVPRASDEPWLWTSTGLRSIVFLTEGVTNQSKDNLDQAEIFRELVITGSAISPEDAQARLQELTILLESGSLPVGVESISKESISPALGEEFLFYSGIMALIALILVALVLVVRYRVPQLVLPIMFTAVAEALLFLGFASVVNFNFDLAAVAGLVAAIGTGVNDQIVITDEVLKGRSEDEDHALGSVLQRSKRALFIVVAAAATIIAAMLPIILFGFGLGKLVGFAITTIVAVLAGALITRPAYNEIVKKIVERRKLKS